MNKLYKKIAIEAALESGRLIRNSVGKVKKISYKGRTNIVTDVDKKAEAIIIRKILRAFPGHSILSEEMGAIRGDSSQAARCGHTENCPLWIIDPLDGTTNFSRSFPFFSVSIALQQEGKIILGVVYDPIRNELFSAEESKRAYLNKKRIHVSATKTLIKSFLSTGFAYAIEEARDDNVINFRNFLRRSLAIRRAGSAALDLCYVACGRFDGFWEMGLQPWDSAAGSLIVREAGGEVTRFDSSPHTPYNKDVLASNSLIHRQMVKILRKEK